MAVTATLPAPPNRLSAEGVAAVSDPFLNLNTSTDSPRQKEVLEFADTVRQDPSCVENLTLFRAALEQGAFSEKELSKIAKVIPDSYNYKLHACFPGDALTYVQALYMIAEHLPPRPNINLQLEWQDLLKSVGMNPSRTNISTLDAFEHFRYLNREQFPDYHKLVKDLSGHLNETLRQARLDLNADLLDHSISVLRVLGYLHKCVEGTHYYCQDEYNVMTRWGVDRHRAALKTLKADEAVEPDMDHQYSLLQERYKSEGVKAKRFEPRVSFRDFVVLWKGGRA